MTKSQARGEEDRRVRRTGSDMAKRYGRPSLQYRYEHYDPLLVSAGRP